jgi:hypothetical protein
MEDSRSWGRRWVASMHDRIKTGAISSDGTATARREHVVHHAHGE